MAKRKTNKKQKRKNKEHSWEQRYSTAKKYLAEKQYPKALAELKVIWKAEKNEAVKADLLVAYVGRARQIANKGLYREACMLLESSHKLYSKPSNLDLFIRWLLRAGAHEKAINIYKQYQTEINNNPHYYSIFEIFAVLLLDNQHDLVTSLSSDSLLVKHGNTVNNAVLNYTQNNNEDALTYLGQISYRSPYRNLSVILKALVVISQANDIVQAKKLLQRVPNNSIFFRMAQIIQATIEPTLPASTLNLNGTNLDTVLALKGVDKQIVTVFKKIAAISNDSPSKLVKLLIKYHELFPESIAKKYAYSLLPDCIQAIAAYEEVFNPIPLDEKNQIYALAADRTHGTDDAIEAWQKYLIVLQKQKSTPKLMLKQAFVMRHIANYIEKRLNPACDCYGCQKNERFYNKLLSDSLDLDPYEKETYFRLIKQYKANANKNSLKLINKMLGIFPRDPEVFRIAVDDAFVNKTYTKAIKLAKEWLQLDSINQSVKTILLDIQLASVKDLLQKNKRNSVKKAESIFAEIESATNQANSSLIALNKLLFEMAKGQNHDAAVELLRNEFLSKECQLAFYCQIALESEQYGVELSELEPVFKQALMGKNKSNSNPDDVIAAFKVLEQYKAVIAISTQSPGIKKIQNILAAKMKLKLPPKTWLWISNLLLKLKLFTLAEVYAVEASKQFKNEPLLIYNLIMAKCSNDPKKLSGRNLAILEQALMLAENNKDTLFVFHLGQYH